MSNWLKSVNTLLDSLDGKAEDVVDVVTDVVNDPSSLPTSRGVVGQVLSRRGMDYDDSEEDFDDDYDDDEEEEMEEEEGEEEGEEEDKEAIEEQTEVTEGAEEEAIHFNLAAPKDEQLFPEDTNAPFTDSANAAEESPDESFVALPPASNDSPVLVEKPQPNEPTEAAVEPETKSAQSVAAELMPPTIQHPKERIDAEDGMVPTPKPKPPAPVEETSNPPQRERSTDKGTDPRMAETSAVPSTEEKEKNTKKKTEPSRNQPIESAVTPVPPVKERSPPRKQPSPPAKSQSSTTTAPSVDTEKLQQQIKKFKAELRKSQTEARQLRKHVMQLNKDLEASEAEVKAQRDELHRAGERMEKERSRMNEDREELMDEHDEELDTQKAQFEKLLAEQKERFENKITILQRRLEQEEDQRRQEGGDWNKELEETIQRERETLKKLNSINEENALLKNTVAKLETQQSALQTRVESMSQASQSALERERNLEDKLDSTLSAHSRQLSQRKAREAELERTVADLGAALASARQKEKSAAPLSLTQEVSSEFRDKYQVAAEEIELLRSQLSMEMERSEALRQELEEISTERKSDTAEARKLQQHHDKEILELRQTVAKLEGSLRDKRQPLGIEGVADIDNLSRELEDAKTQIKTLSADLLRHQSKSESAKTEIFALKNRLQTATQRAESAESELARSHTGRNVYEVESGGVAHGGATMRRRVKGGRNRTRLNQSVRSIRSALNMGPGQISEGPMEQVAITLDAVDGWLLDTGSFMKHEPIARLGLLLYIVVIHFWSFVLMLFHTSSYEEVHGDFGSMGDPNMDQSLIQEN